MSLRVSLRYAATGLGMIPPICPRSSAIARDMELNAQPTEVILNHPHATLGHLDLDWNPEPGAYLDIEGQPYLVLERRHQYQLKSGRYQLHRVTLYVQKSHLADERNLIDGQWMIGDTSCRFNARSELLRCAVNPNGPCDRCIHYQSIH